MAYSIYIALAVAALCITSQITADEPNNATQETTTEIIFVVPENCTNGRGMPGGCVERPQCIFNTTNIDLSLYGPATYRDPCPGVLMCCPDQHIIPKPVTPPSNSTESDEGFDFGDSDEDDF